MTGTYTYSHPTYKGSVRTYVKYQMRVQIISEKANKYKVKYLGQHANGASIGTLHNVRKDKVRLDTHTVVDSEGAPLSTADMAHVKAQIGLKWLPYKDD